MPDVETQLIHGWEVVRLGTEAITVDVVPGLGGTVTSVRRRADDLEILWRTPWGLRPATDRSALGDARVQRWSADPGGWRSIFPNAGDATSIHGTEWGEDGEAWLTPFDHEITAGGSLVLTARLVRAPFEIRKVVSVRGSTVSVGETVHNVGGMAMEVVWGQQVRFGPPLLAAGATVDSAAGVVHPDPEVVVDAGYSDITPWPRSQGQAGMINLHVLPGPDAGERRLVYLDDLDAGTLAVANRTLGLRVELEWDRGAWPYVVYALEAGATSTFPFFDRGYHLTLQPSTSWPAKGLYDARRLSSSTVWIDPGAKRSSHLDLRVGS